MKFSVLHRCLTSLCLVILPLLASVYLMSYDDTKDFETAKNLDIFYSLYTEISNSYVDEIAPGDIMEKTITGLLKTLDPYTVYIPESDVERYTMMTKGEYGGIGASVAARDSLLMIIDIRKDSPAQKAGLLVGDRVIDVDGHSIVDMPEEESRQLMQGQAGSLLRLGIIRSGEKSRKEFSIEREKIHIGSVPYYGMLANQIGYVKLNEFTQNCSQDVLNACVSLQKSGAKGLILDMRDNPGGLLVEAVKIVNLFVPQGEKIVFTKGQNRTNNAKFSTPAQPFNTEIPLAVLVNRRSASASEIVSGSLQDLDRAVIVGERTFGKGLVQTRKELAHNSLLKITTSKYYIPSGRCIQKLDYTHRDAEGNPTEVPDSLQRTFYTRNHRPVKDGGGIIPDVVISQERQSSLLQDLKAQFVFFDYIHTHYSYADTTRIHPETFVLSDADYADFVAYCKTSSYQYNSEAAKQLRAFSESAQKEHLVVDNEIAALQLKLQKQQDSLFVADKAILKKEIASFIIRSLYFEPGQTAYMTRDDAYITEAVNYLGNKELYERILKK